MAIEQFEKLVNLYHENKLSHAYLLVTNNIDYCFRDLKLAIKQIDCNEEYKENCTKCNICNLIDQNYLPSLIVIESDGKNIKKEQILELKRKFSTKPIYTKENIYVIKNAELLKNLLERIDNKNASGEYYLTDIIKIAYEQKLKCVYDIAMENEVMGVNSRNELAVAEKIFQDKKRQEFMLSGVTLQEPSTVYFSYDTIIENDVTIEPNVFFANGVKIKSGTVIKSFSYLEDCEINNNVTIGPFARIRPGTVLKNNCKVGNFCEIKKSTIGNGTKINHLSYIGDTEIGDNTNIGAGTITCNYNGYTKSKTKIGNNSFIGSNTIIIAPINIGNNTMTAAGSVITNDVIDGAIAISRSEQKNLDQGMIRYRKKMGEK